MKVRLNKNSLSAKIGNALEETTDAALNKVLKIGSDAVDLSPIDTAAFVESWSIVPKGSGGGRSRSSGTASRRAVAGKLSAGEKQAIRESQKGVLANDLKGHSEAIISSGGAVVRNRAPHQPYVKPRTEGEGPGSGRGDVGAGLRLLATVRDKNT